MCQFTLNVVNTIVSACGGELTSEHGGIASPNFPDGYPENAECVWTITTSPGNVIIF